MPDSLLDRLLSGVKVATPEESERYFKDGDKDFRWAETLSGADSPFGRPVIFINDKKFQSAGAKNYRDKMITAESLHLMREKTPHAYAALKDAATRDPDYMRWAQESYEHEQKENEERRPFSQWHDVSRFDQVVGGYLFAGDESIPTMREWNRDDLPIGEEFRNELELLRSQLVGDH